MISASAKDLAWQAAWKADIAQRARIEMPALLRSAHTQRLRPLTAPLAPAAGVAPATPLPESLPPRLPDTGAMEKLRETAMVPIMKLLPASDSSELISKAVRWFRKRRGCLPRTIRLNPLRCLALNQTYFPVSCEDIGCYTVDVEALAELARDVVLLVADWYVWDKEKGRYVWGEVQDYYL